MTNCKYFSCHINTTSVIIVDEPQSRDTYNGDQGAQIVTYSTKLKTVGRLHTAFAVLICAIKYLIIYSPCIFYVGDENCLESQWSQKMWIMVVMIDFELKIEEQGYNYLLLLHVLKYNSSCDKCALNPTKYHFYHLLKSSSSNFWPNFIIYVYNL